MSKYKDSRNSIEDYIKWRIQRDKPVIQELNKVKALKGTKVLEIGCGYGSLVSLLARRGANVVGVDINEKSITLARDFLKGQRRVKVVLTKGEILRFKSNYFDIVVLFDVIEHVKNPKAMMREAIRLLKPGGILYCEFTPYYSLIGHHLYDVAKFPIHILPQKYIKWLVYKKKYNGIFKAKEYWDDFKSLNKIKISEFQKHVANLLKIEEKYILKYPDLFEINIPAFAYLGDFQDLLTFSFVGIYQKLEHISAWEERAIKYKKDIRGVLFKKPYPDWVNKSFHSWSFREVANIISNEKSVKILDIACGWGRISAEIFKRFNKVQINGVDISKTFVDIYNKDLEPNGKAFVASMEKLPFQGEKFDTAFLIVSLMYLPRRFQQQKALKEVFRVLKKKGKFVIIERTPLMAIFDIGRLFKKYKSKQISFTPDQIHGLIDSVGGKIIRQSNWPFKFLPLYISYTITKQ